MAGDKGYDSAAIRTYLRWRGSFDRQLYKERNRIERMINRLKQNRRLATRYEKRAENYRAMWVLGAILLWL